MNPTSKRTAKRIRVAVATLAFAVGVVALAGACRFATVQMGAAIAAPPVSVVLRWNPSSSTQVAGYKVLYGQSGGSYTSTLDAGKTTSAVVRGLLPGHTYYFVTVAYTATGAQSSHSNVLAYTVPTP